MKTGVCDLIFMSLTALAALDLLAAIVTDAPNALIGGVLVICLGLMVVNEKLRPQAFKVAG